MSNNKVGIQSVADNARREAKLLARPVKLALDPFGKTAVELKQPAPKELGEYAVIVIATPMTSVQFTIAHPIGITNLDSGEWVAHRSDQLQGILARAKDPDQAAVNQSRTNSRMDLAVAAGLLNEKEIDGKKAFFYPVRPNKTRASLLEDARNGASEATKAIKQQIAALTSENKHEKGELMLNLQRVGDPLKFLDEETQEAERKLREFWNKPEVIERVEKLHPQVYQTLSGPYYTDPQVAIPGSLGKRLEDVAVGFGKAIANPNPTKAVATGKFQLPPTKPKSPGGTPPGQAVPSPPSQSEEDDSTSQPGAESAKGKGMLGKAKGIFSAKQSAQ